MLKPSSLVPSMSCQKKSKIEKHSGGQIQHQGRLYDTLLSLSKKLQELLLELARIQVEQALARTRRLDFRFKSPHVFNHFLLLIEREEILNDHTLFFITNCPSYFRQSARNPVTKRIPYQGGEMRKLIGDLT